jgi:hypothetical protein
MVFCQPQWWQLKFLLLRSTLSLEAQEGHFNIFHLSILVTAKALLFIGFMNYKDSLLITYSRVVIRHFRQVEKMFLGNL